MKATVGIVGWHHAAPGLFARVRQAMQVAQLSGEIHLLDHRGEVPEPVLAAARAENVVVHHFPNVGFDWGAYSQFSDACGEAMRDGDFVVWMHDDVEIRDDSVFARCIELCRAHAVVGHHNALEPTGRPWPVTHPALLYWLERTHGEKITLPGWNTVRGSFVFMRAQVLRRVKLVPYRDGHTIHYGNWGVVLWAGLVSAEFGVDAIGSLLEKPGPALESRWMVEHLRGQAVSGYEVEVPATPLWKRAYLAARRMARTLRDWPPEPPELPGLKVHVGCGRKPILRGDTVNVDLTGLPDLKIPIDQLEFEAGSLAEVSSYHFLEHLTKLEARVFIRRAQGWLKPNGRFVVECPDVAKVARHVIRSRGDLAALEDGAFGLRGLYGEPTPDMTVWDQHKWGYTEAGLVKLLVGLGFRKASVHPPVSHGGLRNRDLRVIGLK